MAEFVPEVSRNGGGAATGKAEILQVGVTTTSSCSNYRLACAHDEMNPKKRCTMEDCHRVVSALGGDPTMSYFGVYDGHGGRQIVEFLETVLGALKKSYEYHLPSLSISLSLHSLSHTYILNRDEYISGNIGER